MFSVTEYYIYNTDDRLRSYSITYSQVALPSKQIYSKSEYIRCYENGHRMVGGRTLECWVANTLPPPPANQFFDIFQLRQTFKAIYLCWLFYDLWKQTTRLDYVLFCRFLQRSQHIFFCFVSKYKEANLLPIIHLISHK